LKTCKIIKKGLTDYKEALSYQRSLFKKRHTNEIGDTLVLTEHNPVYTCGRSADESCLIKSELPEGTTLLKVDRGGSLTFHGPGQLMVYPIIDLGNTDIFSYLRQLEQVAIRAVAVYGIKAHTKKIAGVWIGNKKLASIGIKVSSSITMHGLALNVNCDLSYFKPILACGLKARAVCMKGLLGYEVEMEDIADLIALNFGKIFNYRIQEEVQVHGQIKQQTRA